MLGFFSNSVGIFLEWISLDVFFKNYNFFNLKFFRSLFSQYLFHIFSSIFAYSFLRMVFMSYTEVCSRQLLQMGFWEVRKRLVYFLKKCFVTFFLFLHEASLGWHKQHMIMRIWLSRSKGCFLKVKGQNFDIFGFLDHFLKKLTSNFFLFWQLLFQGWY